MARVSADAVIVVQDNLYLSERVEEAERLRDPTHVRCYTEDEWVGLLEAAGLVRRGARAPATQADQLEPWMERADRSGRSRRLGCGSSSQTGSTATALVRSPA